MAKPKKSFHDWCIENNKLDYLELWDYELNDCSPKDVGYNRNKRYYFKCPKGIHKSELKWLNNIIKPSRKSLIICKQCNSFKQWCIDNNEKDWLLLWDYKLNNCNPEDIAYRTENTYYFKCPRGIHKSEKKKIVKITTRHIVTRCKQCNSFGQYLIDTFGEDALEKYWDYNKNKENPFDISHGSNKKIWVKCQEKKYHGSYEVNCSEFVYKGSRCSFCSTKKVHSKDSFAQYHIDNTDPDFLEKYWSKKNTIDPFSISPCSHKKCWFICQKDEEHEDYKTMAKSFTGDKTRCPICRESKGEKRIREILNMYNINFIAQKTFPNLLGVGNDNLSYDFYLPDYNLLIEYQGEFHDGTVKGTYVYDLEKQQEHDKRKREYAELHDIKLLEIWYYDFDNIEEILNKNIK